MKDYRKNFKLLLERMENKYTLNEVNELLTESIGGGIIKYIDNVKKYNAESLKNVLKSFGINDLMTNTKISFDGVLRGLDDIAKQLDDLKLGRFVENFNAKNAIFANLRKLTSNFVDAELLRIPELRGLDDVEIGNLKSWLMGNDVSFPSKIDINSDVYRNLLNPHRTKMREYLTLAQMTDAINSINKFVGGKVNLKALLLGQLNLKEIYKMDLDSLFNDLIKLDELFTKKIDDIDEVGNIVKVDAFPDFATIWDKFRLDLGWGGDAPLNKEFLNLKLLDEAKYTDLNILDVKNKKRTLGPLWKKYKNLPEIASNKSRGKLTKSDFEKAIVVKNPKDGSVDIYIFKNDNSRKQLENLFKQYGINSENWGDFIKNSIYGNDVADISKKLTRWRNISIFIGIAGGLLAIGIPISLLVSCMSLEGEGIKEEDLNLLKDEDGIDKEKAGKYIGTLSDCGRYAISYGKEIAEPVIEYLWNNEIKPYLIIAQRKIEKKIREICEKNKTENGTECCVLNCDNIQEEIGDESKGYIMDSLGHPLVMEYIKKQGSNVKNIIDKFDKENKIDGILFTESGDVDINEIIRHQCIKIQKENSECIKSSIETVWNSIFEEDNDCTNWLGNKKSKIENLRKYEQFIEFENRVCTDADNTEGEELKVKFCLNNLPKSVRNDVITQSPPLDSFENLEKIIEFQNKVYVQPLCSENNSIIDDKIEIDVEELPTYDTLKDYVMAIWDQEKDGEDWRNCDNYNPSIFDNTTEEGKKEYDWFVVSFGTDAENFTNVNKIPYMTQVDEAWEWLGMTKNNYCKNK